MSKLQQQVGQLLTVEIPGPVLTDQTVQFLEECRPACVALFGRNLAGPWAAARLIEDLQSVAARNGDPPLLIAIDQEGGPVAHLRYPCAEMPAPMGLSAAGGPVAAECAAEILGREMRRLGFNFNFAPVLDLNTNPANPVIGPRAFSDNPDLAAECGVATVNGLRRAGVLSMGKHFPGHGDAGLDSHRALPAVSHGWDRFEAVELKPFRAAIEAGVDTLCSAHIVYPGLDDSGLPATLSPALMTGLLRGRLGFEGALFSDALVMDAVAGIPDAAVRAIRSGVDNVMLLGSLARQRQTFLRLLEAARNDEISQARLKEAAGRIERLRQRAGLPPGRPAAWPDMDHVHEAERLARAAVTLLRDRAGRLPLQAGRVGLVEIAPGGVSPVEGGRHEPLGASTLALLLAQRRPEIKFLALPAGDPHSPGLLADFAADCDLVVAATRSAFLDPSQAALLRTLAGRGDAAALLALRSPYDAALAPEIGTVLLTYSDQPAALAAAAGALLGDFKPTGGLPVRLD